MKKALKIIFSVPVGIIIFVLGWYLLLSDLKYYLDYGETNYSKYEYSNPVFVSVSDSGNTCVIDKFNSVFVRDADYNPLYILSAKDFGLHEREISFSSATFDENDNLYLYYTVYGFDSYVTLNDCIAKISPDGDIINTIINFDYSDSDFTFNRSFNIFALNCHDGYLNFLKKENDTEFREFSYCLKDNGYTKSDLYSLGCNTIYTANYDDNLGYAAILTNGSVILFKDGDYEEIYKSNLNNNLFDLSNKNSILPSSVVVIDDKIYISNCIYDYTIYEIKDGNVVYYTDPKTVCENVGYKDMDVDDSPNIRIFDNNGKLGMSINYIIVPDANGFEADDFSYTFGPIMSFAHFIKELLGWLGIIFIIAGIIISFGAFVKWKMSILAKQLLVTIPFVSIAFIFIAAFLFLEIGVQYYDDIGDKMASIAEIGVNLVDGDELASIKDFGYVDSGKALEYHNLLTKIVKDNSTVWSKKLDASIHLLDYSEEYGTRFYSVANSYNYTIPFLEFYTSDEYFSDLYDGSVSSMSLNSSGISKDYFVYDAAIKDSNGKVVAVFEVSTDNADYTNDIFKITVKCFLLMVILLVIIVTVISVLSYFNVKKIHKASEVVANIANGDFTTRVDKPGKDEVGEICKGVNDMADKLDTLFKEKDENEQFYYKFVPEQFKDLLHKSKFTDLSLGDAESVDLTVLFCDIRSFSISSEMMTAKENFEFINIIFGIAGPIIRKHNGFVDKYIGDAVMALFENADDAILCGEEMYKEIVLNPETAKKLEVSSINVGIGIHTGMARIGIIGEEERMSGTVISNTVNMSSRLEGITKQYDNAMIISKDTLDRITDPERINTRYLGMIQVAGVNEVKALYEVLDCLDEKRFEFRNNNKNEFREAVRQFHLGNVAQSLELFKAIKADDSLDPAITKYIKYIEEILSNDLIDSKVFRFSRK